jgi:methyl-accepting chemotaxis protein
MNFVTDIIKLPVTAQIFILVLLAIFSAGYVRYLRPLQVFGAELDKILGRFGKVEPGEPDRDSGTVEGEHAFQGSGLAGTFTVFEATWQGGVAVLGEERRGTVSPTQFFSWDKLVPIESQRIARVLPGVFSSIGILGTFTGIVLGLGTIDLGTDEALMNSVSGLLGGMNTAFLSSLTGIAFSIVWLLWHRWSRASIEMKLDDLCERLEKKFPIWDSAEVIRFSLVSQEKQLKILDDQKLTLQNLGTDLVGAIETALGRTMTPALSGLTDSFTALAESVKGNQIEGIQELAKEFREQLMGAVDADFERLTQGVKSAMDVQEQTAEKLSLFFVELERVSRGQVELLSATKLASEQFSSSVQGLTEVHGQIRESVPVLSDVAEIAATLLAEARIQSEELAKANSGLREALAQQVDEVQAQVNQLSVFGEEFSGSLTGFRTELQESIVEFRDVAAERLGQVFERFDSEMARVVEHLSGTLAELREVTENLPARVRELRDVVDGLGTPVAEIVDALGSGKESLESWPGDNLKMLEQIAGDLVSASRDLESAMSRLREPREAISSIEDEEEVEGSMAPQPEQIPSGDSDESGENSET